MPYLVKAISTSGIVTWLTGPDPDGLRCVSIRERAETFPTIKDADEAIAKMPAVFSGAGLKFSVVANS